MSAMSQIIGSFTNVGPSVQGPGAVPLPRHGGDPAGAVYADGRFWRLNPVPLGSNIPGSLDSGAWRIITWPTPVRMFMAWINPALTGQSMYIYLQPPASLDGSEDLTTWHQVIDAGDVPTQRYFPIEVTRIGIWLTGAAVYLRGSDFQVVGWSAGSR